MSDQEPTAPKSIVLRVEISAEHAATLAPLIGAATEDLSSAPISDVAGDARTMDVKERQSDLDQREAEFEADVMLREDRMERWRSELEELERTLERRERDLVTYVDQLQGAMSSNSDAWWSRPVGGDGGVR